MAEIPTALLVHEVDVEPYDGDSAYGDTYLAKTTAVPCWRDDTRRMVRNTNGDEVVSETRLLLRLDRAPLFPPDSRVTWGIRTAYVIGVSEMTDGGLGAWQHLEVTLT